MIVSLAVLTTVPLVVSRVTEVGEKPAGFSPTSVTLDTTSGTVVSTANDTITKSAHGYVTGDTLVYKSGDFGGTSRTVNTTSNSVVSAANKTIVQANLSALTEGTAVPSVKAERFA